MFPATSQWSRTDHQYRLFQPPTPAFFLKKLAPISSLQVSSSDFLESSPIAKPKNSFQHRFTTLARHTLSKLTPTPCPFHVLIEMLHTSLKAFDYPITKLFITLILIRQILFNSFLFLFPERSKNTKKLKWTLVKKQSKPTQNDLISSHHKHKNKSLS